MNTFLTMDRTPAESYRVEISGWDALNTFFVEPTTLEWIDRATRRVSLRSNIRQGSVVFLRLLQSLGGGANLPVACKAAKVTRNDYGGDLRVELVPLHSRAAAEVNGYSAE